MVFTLPAAGETAAVEKAGTLIHDLNTLITRSTFLCAEPSVVMDAGCFAAYYESGAVPDRIIHECMEQLTLLHMDRADVYLSVYRDCGINTEPKTVSVSFSGLSNAVTELYERWFDGKPYANRAVMHLEPAETFPALLFQPHRDDELSAVTRHPYTGELMRGELGADTVLCSRSALTDGEETMIREVDRLICLPKRILYREGGADEPLTIRRVVDYRMLPDAAVVSVLSKYRDGLVPRLDALCAIWPENVARVYGKSFVLDAKVRYLGRASEPDQFAQGTAVFPWTKPDAVTGNPILLSDEASMEDMWLIKRCKGAVFSRGGVVSHASIMCKGLGIACVVSARDLVIDRGRERAYTAQGDRIRRGDTICIADNAWSVGGSIVPNEDYRALCTKNTMGELRELALPYADERELRQLPPDKQLHISNLIKILKKSGWIA